jgi:hypothetical protein
MLPQMAKLATARTTPESCEQFVAPLAYATGLAFAKRRLNQFDRALPPTHLEPCLITRHDARIGTSSTNTHPQKRWQCACEGWAV